MIRYLIALFLLIQTHILPINIRLFIDGQRKSDKSINIETITYATNDYDNEIKPYLTLKNLVTDEDIINSETLDMKDILQRGHVNLVKCEGYYYKPQYLIQFNDADNLIFYNLKIRGSEKLNITEDGMVNNCKGKIEKTDIIEIYALTKPMLDTLKKLKLSKLIIKDCRTNTDKSYNMMNINIFDDNIIKNINNNYILDIIKEKTTKKIEDELQLIDADLCYNNFSIAEINETKYNIRSDIVLLQYLTEYINAEKISIGISIETYYKITVNYQYTCPENTRLRKIENNRVMRKTDCFGDSLRPTKQETIKFYNKNITGNEIKKLILKDFYEDEPDAKPSMDNFTPSFNFPTGKEYNVNIKLHEDSEYLRNVKLNIDIPEKTNQTIHKLSGKYIIHCTGDYDKKEVLKEFENQLKKKRNDEHLTSITDNMIQTITQELDQQSQKQYNRLYGLTFDEKSLQKYPDIFKPIPNENQQQNTTTPTNNKNLDIKKPNCCCDCCCCQRCC